MQATCCFADHQVFCSVKTIINRAPHEKTCVNNVYKWDTQTDNEKFEINWRSSMFVCLCMLNDMFGIDLDGEWYEKIANESSFLNNHGKLLVIFSHESVNSLRLEKCVKGILFKVMLCQKNVECLYFFF